MSTPYDQVSLDLFNRTYLQLDDSQKGVVKSISLGAMYGMSRSKLQSLVGSTTRSARRNLKKKGVRL